MSKLIIAIEITEDNEQAVKNAIATITEIDYISTLNGDMINIDDIFTYTKTQKQ